MGSERMVVRGLLAGSVAATVALAVLCNLSVERAVPLKSMPLMRRHDVFRLHEQRNQTAADSTNWSGYAVVGANGSVTDVKGSWVVPAVNCTGSSAAATDGASSSWVGIDGFNSSTVEQIGTDSDCATPSGKANAPTYYAWFEFYPSSAYYIGNPQNNFSGYVVEPSDVMFAEVKAIPNAGKGGRETFTMTITDTRRGTAVWSYSASYLASGIAQSSAEWIAETPCCQKNNVLFPLANFGTANYSGSSATVGGAARVIGAFGNSVQELTMVSEGAQGGSPRGTVMAQPTILSTDVASFSIHWINAGP